MRAASPSPKNSQATEFEVRPGFRERGKKKKREREPKARKKN